MLRETGYNGSYSVFFPIVVAGPRDLADSYGDQTAVNLENGSFEVGAAVSHRGRAGDTSYDEGISS